MCGIVGFYNTKSSPEKYKDQVLKMLKCQVHRGPDEFGLYYDDIVGMGTARLSIIDLHTGQQPIADSEERYWICYNGEVYNYLELRQLLVAEGVIFSTDSDTEVVLHAWIKWGAQGLNKLNGAFAFCIYDRMKKNIVLVRDRYGQRPLFYYENNGSLYFSSEIKSFKACDEISLSIDPNSLASIYYTWGSLPSITAFKDIKQIPNGCFLTLNNEGISIQNYYQLNFSKSKFQGSFNDAVDETKTRLKESVKLRLRSDVEVGTYLSGGLDSSITTALSQQAINRQLNTYSISFSDKEYDEANYQHETSRLIGTKHTSVSISNLEIAQFFPTALWHAEIPLFRTALVPMYLLSKKVNEKGLKVVLTGEGADESFLGYNIFKETILRSKWQSFSDEERQKLILQLYPYLSHFNKENAQALVGVFNRFSSDEKGKLFSHDMRFTNSLFSLKFLEEHKQPQDSLIEYLNQHIDDFDRFTNVEKAQCIEFNTLLSGYLLSSQGDRMSLANSVENRSPFLDYNIVEWAASLPEQYKLKHFNEKYILKEAFKDIIPSTVSNRPKQPYRAPDARSFLINREKLDFLDLVFSVEELQKMPFIHSGRAGNFANKLLKTDPNKISPKYNQSFILLLSTALLNKQFCETDISDLSHIKTKLVKCFNGNSMINELL